MSPAARKTLRIPSDVYAAIRETAQAAKVSEEHVIATAFAYFAALDRSMQEQLVTDFWFRGGWGRDETGKRRGWRALVHRGISWVRGLLGKPDPSGRGQG